MNLTESQKNKLLKLDALLDEGQFSFIKDIVKLEERLDITEKQLDEKIDNALKIAEETQKMEGAIGEKGEQGDRGEKGDRGLDGKNGKDGRDGRDGRDGVDGLNGLNGIDGENGKDGSPDTGKEIVDKINDLDTDDSDLKIGAKHIKNLPKIGERIVERVGGGGLLQVYHDSTLSGEGTQSNPLRVISSGGGVTTVTGTVNGTNRIYTISTEPSLLVIDGNLYPKQSDSTPTESYWSWSGGTLTIAEVITPVFFLRAIL